MSNGSHVEKTKEKLNGDEMRLLRILSEYKTPITSAEVLNVLGNYGDYDIRDTTRLLSELVGLDLVIETDQEVIPTNIKTGDFITKKTPVYYIPKDGIIRKRIEKVIENNGNLIMLKQRRYEWYQYGLWPDRIPDLLEFDTSIVLREDGKYRLGNLIGPHDNLKHMYGKNVKVIVKVMK